jgi:H+/gluconate symporter-like permease
MYCQNCGQSNPPEAVQCSACGVTLAIATPPSPPPAAPRPDIPNHLVWAILATLFCCLPGGIVAIVFAARVDGKVAAGDIQGAISDSNNAKLWSWISFGVGMVVIVLWMILAFIGAMADAGNY